MGEFSRRRAAIAATLLSALGLLVAACGSSTTVASESGPPDSPTSVADEPTSATSSSAVSNATDVSFPDDKSGDLGPLVRCTDVPELAPSVTGSLSQFSNPDDEVVGVLVTYGLEHPDTYAGFWIDRNSGGTLILAFTDDPAPHREAVLARGPSPNDVEMSFPRQPIRDQRPLGERDDIAVDVVHAAFAEAELLAAKDEFWSDRPPYVLSGGLDTIRNRVTVDLIDPTAQQLADLAGRVKLDKTCVNVTISPKPPSGALDVLPGNDATLTCGSSNGPGFPIWALEERVPVEDVDDPVARLLSDVMADPPPESSMDDIEQRPPADGWFVLAIHDSTAIFANGAVSPFTAAFFNRAEDNWQFSGWTIRCAPTPTLPSGLGPVRVELDPAYPKPGPNDTVIHLRVTEMACVGGQAMNDRLRGPQVSESEDQILIAFAVESLVGPATCPGNPSESVAVELAGPLGSRTIRNGLSYPPDEIQ